MEEQHLIDKEWRYVLGLLPDDLEASALEKLAMQRRREISSAADLLRVVLTYSVCDFSLRQTAAWAQAVGLGRLSDVAVLKRLRGAGEWIGYLVMKCLQERGLSTSTPLPKVRVVDATVVSKPGSSGTDWRLHVALDLSNERIRSVEVTGVDGGETFRRYPIEPGEVVVGDRGYCQAPGIASVLDRGGHVVVRLATKVLTLRNLDGSAVDTEALLSTLGDGELGHWHLAFENGGSLYPVRLVAVRKSEAAAEHEIKRLRRSASRKGRTVSALSLVHARFVAVITDIPPQQLPALEVLETYRLRWQVEIAFKRLKSLLDLDHLRAKDPDLARCYLNAKLLAAILIDDLCDRLPAFSPWGYPLLPSSCQPLAITAHLD